MRERERERVRAPWLVQFHRSPNLWEAEFDDVMITSLGMLPLVTGFCLPVVSGFVL